MGTFTKIKNNQDLSFIKNLTKAFGGNKHYDVYQDNALNRKLGRVGQPYPKGKGKDREGGNSNDGDNKDNLNKTNKNDIYESQNWKDLNDKRVNSIIDKFSKYYRDKGANYSKIDEEIDKADLSKGRVVKFPNGSFLIEHYTPKHKDDLKGKKGLLVRTKEDIGGYSNKPTYKLFWKLPNKDLIISFDGKSNAIKYIKSLMKNRDYVR